jgi:hypothetical protein
MNQWKQVTGLVTSSMMVSFLFYSLQLGACLQISTISQNLDFLAEAGEIKVI